MFNISWRSVVPERIEDRIDEMLTSRKVRAIDRRFQQQFDASKEGDYQAVLATWDHEAGWPQAHLGRLRTSRLRRKALSRGLELPNDGSWWATHDESGTKYLTDLGLARAKRLIRDDFRQSAKWWMEVVGTVVALTGLGGVIIGILSLSQRTPQ